MEEAATKIQRFYRDKNQKKKEKQATTKKETKKEATKEKAPEKKAPEKETTEKKAEGYDRENEKNQEIGEEFLNPDEDMEQAATKIQRFYREKSTKKKEK